MGGEFSTDFKSLNRIKLSQLVQLLLNFLLILGVPRGGGGWIWVGFGVGMWGCPMHTHMHTHACTCMLNMINMDASMSVAICNFCTCIHVSVCVCMHACACTHVWGDSHAPRCLQTPPDTCPSPEPQEAQNTKIQ